MNINTHIGSVHITLDTSRIEKNIENAQNWLDNQVLADSNTHVPFQEGALRRSGRIEKPGEIVWDARGAGGTSYAHYQYEGVVYGPNIPISDADGNVIGWYSPPKKQPTGRPLTYGEPGTGAKWFETAKQERLESVWIPGVKKIIEEG